MKQKKYGLRDFFALPFRITPLHTSIRILKTTIDALVPSVNILVTAAFINTAIAVVAGKAALSDVFTPLAAVAAVVLWNILASGLSAYSQSRFIIALRTALRGAMIDKRARLAYRHVESQESWDLIARVSDKPEEQFSSANQSLLGLFRLVFSTLGVLAVIMTQVWWAGLFILLLSLPLFFLAVRGGKKTYEAQRDVTKIERDYRNLGEVMKSRDGVAERAVFGFTRVLNKRYRERFEKARRTRLKVERRYFIRMKLAGVIAALFSFAIVLVLLGPTLGGTLSVGMLISLTNGVLSLIQGMTWELSGVANSLARNREYMKDLTAFAALEEEREALLPPVSPPPAFEKLELRKLSFRYPGTERYILKELSLTIEAGGHYSFVGINGAGKTTVTKLITGLYRDYEGEILLNGRELRTYANPELKAMFCSVFQDFARYSVALRDNIALGRGNDLSEEELARAVALSGLGEAVSKLPEGVGTPLGKIKEEGVDLSGGEWQRVAMARAVVNPAPVLLLDEPTAALDPVAESEVYRKFEEISRGRTTVFISHRLASTQLADIIYVLSEGRVLESGSHDDLMSLGGSYAAMYDSQRSWYLTEEVKLA